MVAQARAADSRDLGPRRRTRAALGELVGAQSGKRLASKIGVLLGDLPNQLEKKRQRARCMLMLHRTMLR